MTTVRPPMDPKIRARLQAKVDAARQSTEREEALRVAAQEAELARIKALQGWPEGRAAFVRLIEEEAAALSSAIAATNDPPEIYRAQGGLRALKRLQENLASTEDSVQSGVAT